MDTHKRFLDVINFKSPRSRIPIIEWAPWWDKTLNRWVNEGMPIQSSYEGTLKYFGLDMFLMIGATAIRPEYSQSLEYSKGCINDQASYKKALENLYPQCSIDVVKNRALEIRDKYDRGEIIVSLCLEGFFWFPRMVFGIENHLYAFYDNPEIMHCLNNGLADFHIKVIHEVCKILSPDMIGIAEDMSYNHGSMISYGLFKKFLYPYYKKILSVIKDYGIKVFVDSDGQSEEIIPWLVEAGVDGIYPLERQAGVDITKIRNDYPDFLMMGGFDKMVMSKGEGAMRAEFERLLPVIRSGGYIPSVDHQTPPEVSMENYKIYIQLLKEYARKVF